LQQAPGPYKVVFNVHFCCNFMMGLVHILTYTSKLTVRACWERNFTTKEVISIFPLWSFHLYVATFQQHLYMEYISVTVNSIFLWVWFLSWFLWYRVAANNEATEPRVILVELFSSFRKRCGRHHDLVNRYGIYVSQMTTDVFHLS
jgi:hypothetical protein